MNHRVHAWGRRATLLAAAAGMLGCAQVGPALGDPGRTGPRATVVQAEVRAVNARAQRIQLREVDGRIRHVRYDGRTRVIHRRQQYPVTALRAGDRVSVRLAHDRGNQARAVRIDVHDARAASGQPPARAQRVDGTVGWVDPRRGSFSVSPSRQRSLVVFVPNRLSRADQQRFNRLRRGDRIRADIRPIGRDQYELVRFR